MWAMVVMVEEFTVTGIFTNSGTSVSTLLSHLKIFMLTETKSISDKPEAEIWGTLLMRHGHVD